MRNGFVLLIELDGRWIDGRSGWALAGLLLWLGTTAASFLFSFSWPCTEEDERCWNFEELAGMMPW
jgi:hypothetical protein